MMHRAWSSIVEVPYCFSRSYVKFQGHTALKIVEFERNWAFPDSNSSFNSLMAMKCCTKLETAKERCPIVSQGHPSNFKVTQDKTSPILTQIGRFQTIGRSQLSNPKCLFNSLSRLTGIHRWTEDSPHKRPVMLWRHHVYVKFQWVAGDFIISDNLALGHEASTQTQLPRSQVGLRIMHRTTIGGRIPPAKSYTKSAAKQELWRRPSGTQTSCSVNWKARNRSCDIIQSWRQLITECAD